VFHEPLQSHQTNRSLVFCHLSGNIRGLRLKSTSPAIERLTIEYKSYLASASSHRICYQQSQVVFCRSEHVNLNSLFRIVRTSRGPSAKNLSRGSHRPSFGTESNWQLTTVLSRRKLRKLCTAQQYAFRRSVTWCKEALFRIASLI
jgi:hypothetical protein